MACGNYECRHGVDYGEWCNDCDRARSPIPWEELKSGQEELDRAYSSSSGEGRTVP